MTSRERVEAALAFAPVDKAPLEYHPCCLLYTSDTLEYYKNVPLRPTGYGPNLALMMLVELLVWDAQGLL